MAELFVYDASDVNRPEYKFHDHQPTEWPVEKGFREALIALNPSSPFLVRTIFGDYERQEVEFGPRRKIIKPTFLGRDLSKILKTVLIHGHDRYRKRCKDFWKIRREIPLDIRLNQAMWAESYSDITQAHPYRFDDDTGMDPQGTINDFNLIFNRRVYRVGSDCVFYQPDIEKRRRALLGIIISDTNPERQKLEAMRFTLTPENLEQVVAEIKRAGYFQ